MLIAVTGTARRAQPAERGILRLRVALESSSPDSIFSEVTAIYNQLREDAEDMRHADQVTWWSANQVRSYTQQRYLKDSDVRETYYVVSGEMQVKFSDFAALARWVAKISPIVGVEVQGVSWALTEKKKVELQAWARTAAITDAVQRAKAYASAAGFSNVEIQAVYEPGLRPTSGMGGGNDYAGATPRAMAKGASSAAGYDLKPDDIEVAATITADFSAHA